MQPITAEDALTFDINTCQVENVTPDPGVRLCFIFPFLCFSLTESGEAWGGAWHLTKSLVVTLHHNWPLPERRKSIKVGQHFYPLCYCFVKMSQSETLLFQDCFFTLWDASLNVKQFLNNFQLRRRQSVNFEKLRATRKLILHGWMSKSETSQRSGWWLRTFFAASSSPWFC